MRRPLIQTDQNLRRNIINDKQTKTKVELQPFMLEKRLRQKRSQSYLERMSKLDISGTELNKEHVKELINELNNEFPDLMESQIPIGIVSKCYLGKPFEVHILDTMLEIVEHYERGKALPTGLEKARVLALNPNYYFIEVFHSYLVAVQLNGQVSMIKE